MRFQKLSKEKRNHLILVTFLTLGALGGLGFGLIRYQYDELQAIADQTTAANKKLIRMKSTVHQAEDIESKLTEVTQKLAVIEADMASGDTYSWGLDVLRRFRAAYKVDVPSVNQPVIGDTTLLPKFPYKQASFGVSGTAYYHDFGRFIADFENQFPYFRIVNLNLDPVSSLMSAEREKLEFKMEVVAPVRPNQN